MNVWEDQKRLSETFLLKGSYEFNADNKLILTAMYSPHSSTYPKRDVHNGAFSNNGGGTRVNAEWQHNFSGGDVKTYLGYKETHNKIKHDGSNFYNWWNKPDANGKTYFDWCTSYVKGVCSYANDGGYGEFETGNTTWTVKQDYRLQPLHLGAAEHNIDGAEVD